MGSDSNSGPESGLVHVPLFPGQPAGWQAVTAVAAEQREARPLSGVHLSCSEACKTCIISKLLLRGLHVRESYTSVYQYAATGRFCRWTRVYDKKTGLIVPGYGRGYFFRLWQLLNKNYLVSINDAKGDAFIGQASNLAQDLSVLFAAVCAISTG